MSPPADIEENKARLRRFYERSHENNLAVYDEMRSPEFVNRGGPFLGLPPTGKAVRWTGMAIYRFDDQGRITERWQEIDGLGLFAQLGLLPPMPGPGGPPPEQ